jgi:hypothetical protein
MADNIPVASSGPREPVKRPKPIPKVVKEACLLMVYGDPEDEDGGPVDFISAAKAVGMRPDTLRRYLGRPTVIAFLRSERRTFRESVLAGTELALRSVRDGAGHTNPMARVAAARALEQLEDADSNARSGSRQQLPGLVVQINVGAGANAGRSVGIDQTIPQPLSPHAFGPRPAPQQQIEHAAKPADPATFKPRR